MATGEAVNDAEREEIIQEMREVIDGMDAENDAFAAVIEESRLRSEALKSRFEHLKAKLDGGVN